MKKQFRFLTALLSVLCLIFSVFPVTVWAGSSRITIDDSSFAEKINNTIWNNPSGDVISQDGKLIFPAESTGDTRLISKTAVSKSDVTDEMLHAAFQLDALQIPEGETFLFACGLRSIESLPGEKGNVELQFTNNGGVQAGLLVYETSDSPVALAESRAVSGSTISVEMTLTASQKLTVKINGTVLYDGALAVTGEGRVGFLQSGSCQAEISAVKVEIFSYNTPENANVMENFDNGTMDTSLLSCGMIKDFGYYPCRISVDEYNGNNVMLFKNSGLGYIGTKYQYSNFELTFDVPYLQREEVYSENFELLTPKSSWFGITFGDEYMDATWYDYDYKSPYMIYFNEWSNIIDFKNNSKVLASLAETDHAFFAEGEQRGFSVRFAVVDAHVEIGIKWMEEENFTTVCEYDIANGQTPTGYIHIWGSEPNNFAIDNIVITNKDKNAQLTQTEYKAGTVIVPEDHSYEKAEMTFRDTESASGQENEGFNWYLLIPCAGGVSVLCILVSALIAKNRKKKEVA